MTKTAQLYYESTNKAKLEAHHFQEKARKFDELKAILAS